MPIEVLMPALSPTMEEGTLAKWLVKPGDAVKSGDVIAEIETDKATMDVEAVDEGVVEALLVPEGTEEVKVNTPIARLSGEGAAASPSPMRGGARGGGLPPPTPLAQANGQDQSSPTSPPPPTPSPRVRPSGVCGGTTKLIWFGPANRTGTGWLLSVNCTPADDPRFDPQIVITAPA